MTLREVGIRSGGTFTPTAVAGYERAERSISLERFSALCAFYGVAPDRLLGDVLRRSDDRLIFIADPDRPEVDVPHPAGV
jgi:transcriptional regulator with XRE-family HTH domain